jgi:hypothetical protein
LAHLVRPARHTLRNREARGHAADDDLLDGLLLRAIAATKGTRVTMARKTRADPRIGWPLTTARRKGRFMKGGAERAREARQSQKERQRTR